MRFKGCGCTTEPIIQPTARPRWQPDRLEAVYRIENMDCPHRRGADPKQTGRSGGVVGLEFNLMQRTLAVQHELPSLSPVEQALKAIGMQAVRMDQASAEQTTKLSIAKMDCPTEETLIRNKLGHRGRCCRSRFQPDAAHAVGTPCEPGSARRARGTASAWIRGAGRGHGRGRISIRAPVTTPTNWWPLGISSVTASAAEAVYWLHNGNHWSVVVLALVAVLTGGLHLQEGLDCAQEP